MHACNISIKKKKKFLPIFLLVFSVDAQRKEKAVTTEANLLEADKEKSHFFSGISVQTLEFALSCFSLHISRFRFSPHPGFLPQGGRGGN